MERIFPSEQGRPGGGADLLTVGLLQPQAVPRQSLQGAGRHVRVVPGHVIVAKVIGQDKNYIWLLFLSSNYLGETEKREAESLDHLERRGGELCGRERLYVTIALISHHTLGQAFVD